MRIKSEYGAMYCGERVEFMLRVNFEEYERGFFRTRFKPLRMRAVRPQTNWECASKDEDRRYSKETTLETAHCEETVAP